jgi:hypothetical protein
MYRRAISPLLIAQARGAKQRNPRNSKTTKAPDRLGSGSFVDVRLAVAWLLSVEEGVMTFGNQ